MAKPIIALDDFFERLNKVADSDLWLFCSADNPPSMRQFDALEKRLQWKFPKAYRAFILRFGGAILEANERVWPRPKRWEVGPY
jgi:hypothetical protein